MSNFRKLTHILSAASLGVLLLTLPVACGDENEEDTPPPPKTEEQDPDPQPDPQPDPAETNPEWIAGKIYIDTNGAPIDSKEEYVACSISFTHDCEQWNFSNVTAGIRGRGNSTWLWYPKKPYRIKFDKKQDVAGLDAAKSWVLLAEYRDPTSLMNAFVFELGRLAGMPFTNHSRFVELMLNGKSAGLYHLTEQVQQNKVRVNIDEKEGYLIQLDRDDGPELAPGAGDNFWSAVYGMPVCVKNPEDLSDDILSQIRESLRQLETSIKASDFNKVSSLLDVDTMIDFLLIQEFVYNVELDAPRSMYMHRDKDSRWAMGPLWDFDAGFDFDWGNMTVSHNYFARYDELVLGTSPVSHKGTMYNVPGFFSDLFKMREFVTAYKARWSQLRPLIDCAWRNARRHFDSNPELWDTDARLWPIGKDAAKEVGRLESWIFNRSTYLNEIINNYPDGQ